MSNKHQKLMTQLVAAVYHGRGVTSRSLRTAIKKAVAPTTSLRPVTRQFRLF